MSCDCVSRFRFVAGNTARVGSQPEAPQLDVHFDLGSLSPVVLQPVADALCQKWHQEDRRGVWLSFEGVKTGL